MDIDEGDEDALAVKPEFASLPALSLFRLALNAIAQGRLSSQSPAFSSVYAVPRNASAALLPIAPLRLHASHETLQARNDADAHTNVRFFRFLCIRVD